MLDALADPVTMPAGWPRRFCCEEDLALIGYDGRDAAKDLASLHARGPRPTTQELIDVIRADGVAGAVVLDVGAGIGAVHLALLEAGAGHAIDVDASREYLAAAREEARRRGHAEHVDYRHGDIVELAPDIPRAEIVTLDSVICCYPYLPALLAAAVMPGPRLVGLTYPRDTWWMRAFMLAYNVTHSLARSPARYFAHRHRTVRRLLAEAGYAEIHDGGSPAWRVAVYRAAKASKPAEQRYGHDTRSDEGPIGLVDET
ncbi:MAG TPA: methyltransferase domain-containing protein [Candidatus Limnocylindria bacterium]|nr:methyltransferase domain-containing protein [Candidatus Limnocylindria bacterium]